MAATCRCGHGPDHHMVTAEPSYGFMGWLLIIVGATPTPHELRYRCRVCDQVFARTTDPTLLRSHR